MCNFLDYINGNTKLSLICAIDFTDSNKKYYTLLMKYLFYECYYLDFYSNNLDFWTLIPYIIWIIQIKIMIISKQLKKFVTYY